FNIDSCSVFMSYHVSPPHLDPPSFPTRRSSDLGLKRWDLRASKQPDYFIANSQFVAARIKRAYGREATVIPPPIDVSRFQIAETDRKSTRLNSSHEWISYAVFCLKKKKQQKTQV